MKFRRIFRCLKYSFVGISLKMHLVESRESPLANKKQAYNYLTLGCRNSLTNQICQYIDYNHMTRWWLLHDVGLFRVIVCTLSTAEYGTFDVLFQKHCFTNDLQQHTAWLEGNFSLLVFYLSQESSGEKKEFLFKVLVIGDLGVGKTSIIKRYVHQFFSVHYRATISFPTKRSKVNFPSVIQ